MTTCDESTRTALKAAIGDRTQLAWAKANRPETWTVRRFASLVSNVLLRKGVSEGKENLLRDILGLEPIYRTPVIVRSNQKVVYAPGYGRKRNYEEFKIRVSPDEAEIIRQWLAEGGWDSFSEWWKYSGQFLVLL